MVITDTNASFQPSVELGFAPGFERSSRRKSGDDVHLVARFKDFLGEPTGDIGLVSLSTTRGALIVPTLGTTGTTINLDPAQFPVPVTGELPLVLRPRNESGKAEVILTCKLGSARLEVDLPKPAGFALTEILESVVYAFLVAIIIRIFFFQTFWIPSGSMEPNLHEKDRIIANKLVYRLRAPMRGEVVIFRVFQPGNRGGIGRLTYEEAVRAEEESSMPIFRQNVLGPKAEDKTIEVQDYIKRVIGLPGDIVEVSDGIVLVNGQPLQERYQTMRPNYQSYGPIRVPPGEVFVLGDNRANSQDSHVIGTVPIRNIEGRAELVFWPPTRIGLIPQSIWSPQ